jgi:hypothetical protein
MRLPRIGQHIKDEPCAKQRALLGVSSSRYSSVSRGVRSAAPIFFSLPLVQPVRGPMITLRNDHQRWSLLINKITPDPVLLVYIQLDMISLSSMCRFMLLNLVSGYVDLYSSTVRDDLFRLCPNLGQRPPFFSKMRTFFKNRPPWLKFYFNFGFNHGGRFLSCIFKNKFFFFLWDSQSDR